MSFVVAGLTTLGGGSLLAGGLTAASGISAIGKSLFGGFSAMGGAGEIEEATQAARQVHKEQMGVYGSQRDIAKGQARLGYDVASAQYGAGKRDVSMGTQAGMRDITASQASAISQSGMATSGTIESKTAMQTGDLMAKYKSDMSKLVESRQFAEKERDLSLSQADLSYRKGQMSAEEVFQGTKTELEAQPSNFLEGVFS